MGLRGLTGHWQDLVTPDCRGVQEDARTHGRLLAHKPTQPLPRSVHSLPRAHAENSAPRRTWKRASGHFSYLRVIQHHGTGRAEGQKSSGPGAPAQGSPHPVWAAKHVSYLQHRRYHAASWAAAETWARTSALGAELLAQLPLPLALSAPRFRGGRGRGGGGYAPAPPGPPPLLAQVVLSARAQILALFWIVAQRRSTTSVPGTKALLEWLRTFHKDPGLVCLSGPSRCPSRPGRGTGLAGGPGAPAADGAGRGAWRASLGPQKGAGPPRASRKGPSASWCQRSQPTLTAPLPLTLLLAPWRRRTGGHADPPHRDGIPGRTAHALKSWPAEAVVRGGALRAAVISNCPPAPGRRGAWGAASRWLRGGIPARGAAG